jgi:hypothetical protein
MMVVLILGEIMHIEDFEMGQIQLIHILLINYPSQMLYDVTFIHIEVQYLHLQEKHTFLEVIITENYD